jgi:hypothetical protein
MKTCTRCHYKKEFSHFYYMRNACKECLNLKRRSLYKMSNCRHCKTAYRPGVEGRYKFCSEMCRFMIKVKKQKNECWIWQAGISKDGYGQFVHSGLRNGLAHRAAYRLFKGPISDGLLVLHSCHIPLCVAPDHLRQGTDADNMQDKVKANRCFTGYGRGKLTEENVRFIRSSSLTQVKLAEKYNVHVETIGHVIRRKTWKHV